MPVRSAAACFLVVVALLAVSVSVAGTAVAAPAGEHPVTGGAAVGSQTTATNGTNATDAVASINQTIRIDVRPSGDARWTVTMRATMTNGSDVPLSELALAYENGDTEYLPIELYRTASDLASASTGRQMEIRDVSRRATTTERTIAMELSFTWTNFGTVEDDRLVVRDVFNGTTGRWFPSLERFQTLILAPPDGYDIFSVDNQAALRNRTLRWNGPVTFDEETPYVIYVESGPTSPTPTMTLSPTTGAPSNGTTPPGPNQGENGLLVPAVVVLLVGLLAVLAVVASRSDGPLIPPAEEVETEASDGGTVEPPAESESESAAASTESPADAEAASEPGAAGTDEQPDDDIDEALLSDEERVERLLERNGGRMKQANIVNETDWSNAKVSQLLSSMAEDGRIEKLRIGRENLISFPDEDDEDLP